MVLVNLVSLSSFSADIKALMCQMYYFPVGLGYFQGGKGKELEELGRHCRKSAALG